MTAIVTGCAQGIGKAIFLSLLKEEEIVVGIDKNKAELEEMKKNLDPAKAVLLAADLAHKDEVDACIRQIFDLKQDVSLIVNNACFTNKGLLSGCSWEEFNEVLHTAVTAPYWLASAFQNNFSEDACIINISSTRARQSQKDTESYSAAKGAIEALTRAMAMSLAGKCRVNCIAPGWIDTFPCQISDADLKQQPSGRIGTPQDIVEAVQFFRNPANSFINAAVLTIDGGMSARMIYHNDEGWTYHE